jgi:hydrogenase maturation protein HypF
VSVATVRRIHVRVQGAVQGVGFRPYVYRLADDLGLAGFVLNDARGVLLEVEGASTDVERFLARLAAEAPPLAAIERVEAEDREPIGRRGFEIVESRGGGVPDAHVTPDTATCADCLQELFDPRDRRFRYPFTNCTNCGPRFSIVQGVPYDRPLTTMSGFRMCSRCRAEYDDPANRRFHAQPNACPECGPSVSLVGPDGAAMPIDPDTDPVRAAAVGLRGGLIVAVKGIGGYHLACRADDDAAVSALRRRKHREDRPFALMVAALDAAGALVELGPDARALLSSPARPIVIARRREDAAVAPAVAPGVPELGVMLPYSPLHHLLLADFAAVTSDPTPALVMTSGNVSDEPIAYRDPEALARLGGIADLVLVHDRPIQTRTDDSVLRVVDAPDGPRRIILRRSRGYVPADLSLPDAAERPILACGAELKNTFCVARGTRAWVGHHIGDLENYETLESFMQGVEHFERLFAVTPEVVAHDLHPEYLSTKYALERDGVRLVGVQHHHAHLAAALAEHGEPDAVGAIFDGTGHGSDGTIWGGELLYGGLDGFERVGKLLPVRLAGGAQAIRQPWRMACAWLAAAGVQDGDGGEPPIPRRMGGDVDEVAWRQVADLIRTGVASPMTTSMGRLFDAVSALCGLRQRVTFEGQAAVELEAACDPAERGSYPVGLDREGPTLVIDPRETIRAVAADLEAGAAPGAVASRFHTTMALVTVEACSHAARACGTDRVVLSGGVFQNRRLIEGVAAGLRTAGLRVLVPERLPVNDGGISYGQAAIAARLAARSAE